MSASSAPTLSVVLPTYGVEKYIDNALFGLRNQTFADFEIIVVDDVSPDESMNIARKHAAEDDRIRLVHHAKNRGPGGARNTGLSCCKGEYVLFLDPDDEYSQELLAKVAIATQDNPDVIVYGHCDQVIDSDENVVSSRDFTPPCAGLLNQQDYRRNVLFLERHTMLGYPWNKAFKRSVIERCLFPENTPLVEDALFNMEACARFQNAAFIQEVLYFYKKRQNANQTSKFVPEYYEMHRLRVSTMRNVLSSWNMLDEQAKGTLGGIYTRYILSALERNCDSRSNMDKTQLRNWCREVMQDELFIQLIMETKPVEAGKATVAARKLLLTKNAAAWIAAGKALHAAKSSSKSSAWSSATSNR